MEKLISKFSETIFLILLAILLLSSSLIAQQPANIKIGFCLDDYNVDRWYSDRDYFTNKVKELGGEVYLEVAYSEPVTQIKQIRQLIAKGVQVLVIVPTDGNGLTEVIAEAKKKGVQVIAYDRIISNADIDYYLSYNNEQVGELMAAYMVAKRPSGKYAILSGPDSDPNAMDYKAGQMKVLKPYIERGEIELVYDEKVGEWTEMEAMIMLDDFLGNYTGPLDVVLAANDGLASGVVMALESNREKVQPVLVSGQDADAAACRQIYAGRQAMTIYKPVKPLAYRAAELAVALAKKEKVDVPLAYLNNGTKEVASILFTPIAVDKQNMAATVVADKHIQQDELKK